MIDNQRGYNHLISNKREWNYCFVKNNQEILLIFLISLCKNNQKTIQWSLVPGRGIMAHIPWLLTPSNPLNYITCNILIQLYSLDIIARYMAAKNNEYKPLLIRNTVSSKPRDQLLIRRRRSTVYLYGLALSASDVRSKL